MPRYYNPDYVRARRAQLAASGEPQYIPAEVVAEHVADLIDAGATASWIATAARVSQPTVTKLVKPTIGGRLRARVARAILAVTPETAFEAAPDTSYIPAAGARRRLQHLQLLGWRHEDFHAHGVSGTSLLLRESTVVIRMATHRAVCAMYATLSTGPGPSEATRRRAKAKRHRPASAWGPSIDDPRAVPQRRSGGRRGPTINLDEVAWLLRAGETLERTADRLNVAEDSIKKAARTRGTPLQRKLVDWAACEIEEIRDGLRPQKDWAS